MTVRCFLLLVLAITSQAQDANTLPKGGRGVSLDDLIRQLDTNHDGKVSRDEATGNFAPRFSPWDANHDGVATRDEIHSYRQGFGINDQGERTAATNPGAPRRVPAVAVILKEPTDWRLETMSVPPGFAPEVKLKGSEEIRFAPGMFDNTSDTYFTCALAIIATDAPDLGAGEIKDFLEKYYRGLSGGRAQRSQAKVDPAQMQAEVNAVPAEKNRFTATIDFFDSFSDGRKIKLNVEASIFARPAKKETSLILLVSPSAKDRAVWPTLREIGRKAEANVTTTASAPPIE